MSLEDPSLIAEITPRRRRPWITVAKFAMLALVLWGIHQAVERGLGELSELDWRPRQLNLGLLAGSATLYLLGLAPAGVYWWQLLRKLGQHPRLSRTLRAYYVGHLGKYVPGKALVVILRAALVRSEHVQGRVAATAVFCETLTMMAVGAFVGGAVVAALFRQHLWLMLLALGLMVAAGLPTLPAVFNRLVKLARRGGQASDVEIHFNVRTLASGWLANLIGWPLIGASLLMTVHASGFGNSDRIMHEWVVCTGAAALAVVAGFASLIPGGLGVRGAVLMVFLKPTFGEAGALVATIVARLVWLVAEAVISIILYPWRRGPS